ncbi:hypothetical protein HDU96_010618 [Phlyctochytrium bullatum]|nr:hypothetical protein HDU96_010618 [Phlyctochytrium bullatum]
MEPLFALNGSSEAFSAVSFNPHTHSQPLNNALKSNPNPNGPDGNPNPFHRLASGDPMFSSQDFQWSSLQDMMESSPAGSQFALAANNASNAQPQDGSAAPGSTDATMADDFSNYINAFATGPAASGTDSVGGAGSSGNSLLMHLEQLHGVRPEENGGVHVGGIDWSAMSSMNDNYSYNTLDNASSNGNNNTGPARLTPLFIPNSQFMPAFDPATGLNPTLGQPGLYTTPAPPSAASSNSLTTASTAPPLSGMPPITPASAASNPAPSTASGTSTSMSNYDNFSDTASILSTATLATALTASSNPADFHQHPGLLFPSPNPLISPHDHQAMMALGLDPGTVAHAFQPAAPQFFDPSGTTAFRSSPPHTNVSSSTSPSASAAAAATGGAPGSANSTPGRRRRALTIPNSQPKTVLKAYAAAGTGAPQPGAPGPAGSQLSPIPSSPYATTHHANGFAGALADSHPKVTGMTLAMPPPFVAGGPVSSAPSTPPAVPRLPIMPLAPSNSGKNNPATHPDGTPLTPEELFKKLDDDLEKINFDDITVSELKEHLRIRGLPSSGKKALLVQRLQDEIKFIKMRREGTLRPEEDPRIGLYNHVLALHGLQPAMPPPGTPAAMAMAAAVYGSNHPALAHHVTGSGPASPVVSYPGSPVGVLGLPTALQAQQVAFANQQMAMARASMAASGPFGPAIGNPTGSTSNPTSPTHLAAAAAPAPTTSPSALGATLAHHHHHRTASAPSTPPANPSSPSLAGGGGGSTTASPAPTPHSPLTQRRPNVARSTVVQSQRQRSHSDSRMARPRLEDLGLDAGVLPSGLVFSSTAGGGSGPTSPAGSTGSLVGTGSGKTSPTGSPQPLAGRPRAASSAVRPHGYHRLQAQLAAANAAAAAAAAAQAQAQATSVASSLPAGLTQIITDPAAFGGVRPVGPHTAVVGTGEGFGVGAMGQPPLSAAAVLGGGVGASGPHTASILELAEGTMAMTLEGNPSAFFHNGMQQ